MKCLLPLSACIGAAVAQDCLAVAMTAVPGCAQNCILDGAPSIGCGSTDFSCQCEKEAALYAAIEGCVSSACPSASYQAVIDGASSLCNCATRGIIIATTTDANEATTTTATMGATSTNTMIEYTTQPTTAASTAPSETSTNYPLTSPPTSTVTGGGTAPGHLSTKSTTTSSAVPLTDTAHITGSASTGVSGVITGSTHSTGSSSILAAVTTAGASKINILGLAGGVAIAAAIL